MPFCSARHLGPGQSRFDARVYAVSPLTISEIPARIPLVITRAAVSPDELWECDRANIPENNDIRKEQEEAEFYEHTPYLDDDELELVYAFKALPPDLKDALRFVSSSPQWLSAISQHLSAQKGK